MTKLPSSLTKVVSRLLKILVLVLLVPVVLGLMRGILEQLEFTSLTGGRTFRTWLEWGVMSYVWTHLLLYRPTAIFRVSHRLFSLLAVWLFGGQVTSVQQSGGGKGGGKGATGDPGSHGSTLVAFSPYVVPLYTVLVCAAGWALGRWVGRAYVDGPVGFLIGATIAFHWLMSADDLQQQRERWYVETYLLAIGLVFALTLIIGGACLPWAIPEFSFLRALADGLANAQAIYASLIERLFF